MEQNFGERLKNYRRAKNLTQQELADILGVSNKTVSRWESGGYPDLGMLVPLARALGITVDDLLDGEKPIRTLTRADWQNFLSFTFALGGGVLFFLLDLFMPVVLCYLAYLMCMIYGVYLQRYYCYQTRWFRVANSIMNLSVNISMAYRCVAALATLVTMLPDLTDWEFLIDLYNWIRWYVGSIQVLGFLLALIATGVTLCLVERKNFSFEPVQLYLRRPTGRDLVPALCAVILGGFWMVFRFEPLPLTAYQNQANLYRGLLTALVILCVVLYWRRYRRGLLSTAILLVGGVILKNFGQLMVYIVQRQEVTIAGKVYQNRAAAQPDDYYLFNVGNVETILATVVLVLLCVAVTFIGFQSKPRPVESTEEPEESEL